MSRPIHTLLSILIGITLLLGAANSAPPPRPAALAPGTYIVQASSAAAASAAVREAGGAVTQALSIIGGVAATLDAAALDRLQGRPGVTLHADRPVRVADHDEHETRTRGYLLYPAVATGAFGGTGASTSSSSDRRRWSGGTGTRGAASGVGARGPAWGGPGCARECGS